MYRAAALFNSSILHNLATLTSRRQEATLTSRLHLVREGRVCKTSLTSLENRINIFFLGRRRENVVSPCSRPTTYSGVCTCGNFRCRGGSGTAHSRSCKIGCRFMLPKIDVYVDGLSSPAPQAVAGHVGSASHRCRRHAWCPHSSRCRVNRYFAVGCTLAIFSQSRSSLAFIPMHTHTHAEMRVQTTAALRISVW